MRLGQWVTYLGCSFSIGVFSAFNNFTLTLWLAGFTSSYVVLGLLGNTRSFEGTLVAPAVGVWSDRVWLGRLGRRRPFILFGGLLSALLLAVTPELSRLPMPALVSWLPYMTRALAPAVAIIFLFTLTFNAMNDIHAALLVDITSEQQRNRLSALRIVVAMAGQVAILVLGFFIWRSSVPDSAFRITALLMAAGVLLTVAFVKEPSPAVWEANHGRGVVAETVEHLSLWSAAKLYRGASVFCIVVFFYWAGVNAVQPLISIYVVKILHATFGQAQLLPALLLVSTTVFALPMAALGNRFGKRRMIAAGYLVVALAGLAGLKIVTKEQGAILFFVTGIGIAASEVLTVPLLADLVSPRHIGAATGILAGSGSVAAPVASLIAGHLSDVYGPRVIFLWMSVTVLIALSLLPFVRLPAVEAAPPPAGPQARAAVSRETLL